MKHYENYRIVVDDFQHKVENKIKNYKNENDFPEMGSRLSHDELSDYLFEYQAALDSEGTERTRYTIAGFLLSLPIIVLSGFQDEMFPMKSLGKILIGLAIGLVLFLLYRILMKVNVRRRINKTNREYPMAKEYVDEVLAYNPR